MFCYSLQKPNTVQWAKIQTHVLGGLMMDHTVQITQLQNIIEIHTLRSINDVTEGSTQEACMCAFWIVPRKVAKMV